MPRELKISVGQYSDKGRKETNQDFHGVLIPTEPLLSLKGIAIVLADGISSSSVSRVAAESAVKGFLTDYYCTSESWSVRTSAQRVGRGAFADGVFARCRLIFRYGWASPRRGPFAVKAGHAARAENIGRAVLG